jgi:hypothetical protein
MSSQGRPTLVRQIRMHYRLKNRGSAGSKSHPGQARRSARKRELKSNRRTPSAQQIAEGLALREGRGKINHALIAGDPSNARWR